MVVLWRIGNLELAATAQVDELAREPKCITINHGQAGTGVSGLSKPSQWTKEVLWLACQGVDSKRPQIGPEDTVFMAHLR